MKRAFSVVDRLLAPSSAAAMTQIGASIVCVAFFVHVLLDVPGSRLQMLDIGVFVLAFASSMITSRNMRRVMHEHEREVAQRQTIERLSEEQSEFMTFASHEIRNPITTMRGYASLIYEGTMGEASQQVKDTAMRISVVGEEVLRLIGGYLEKAKLELGQLTLSKTEFDIAGAVALVTIGFEPHARQKGIDLQIDIEQGDTMRVVADEMRVKEVVGNLIDNSLKYTQRGSITVRAQRDGTLARIVVEDTGVGITPDVLPTLFEKFRRADTQRINLVGTGIGLYLAKTLTERMGGHIRAESDGPGKGSRFVMEFPIASSPIRELNVSAT